MTKRAKPGHALFFIIFAVLLALDLWSKDATFSSLSPPDGTGEHEVWPGVFKLRLVHNPGMMWGMAQDVQAHWWVLIRSAVLVGLLWLYFTLEPRTRFAQIAFGLVAAGALGNIFDNVFQGDRLFEGQVRDFLHFYWFEFPTFNVADSCICVGAPLLLLVLWHQDRGKAQDASTAQSSVA